MPIPTDYGPRHVLLGDPTTALGADMLAIGLSPKVTVTPTQRQKVGRDVFGNEAHEGRFYQGLQYEIEVMVPRAVATDVRSYIEIAGANGDYVSKGASLTKQTLVLVHPDDAADDAAGASAKTRWFPSVRLQDIGAQEYDGEEDGIDGTAYVPLTFITGYIDTDQDGDDVPEAAQPDFHGDRLSSHGMSWVLPDPYGPAS